MPRSSTDPWALPPVVPWPRFLRLLRQPDPPRGWLEAAADLPELKKRPLLLRWIAQHSKAPAHLRSRLLARLPWRALVAVASDPAAHPQARQQATEKLQQQWTTLTTGERRSLAIHAPRSLWPLVWRTPTVSVLMAFLQHPKLGLEALIALILPPLRPAQADALAASRWREMGPVAEQVLRALDQNSRPARLRPRPGPCGPLDQGAGRGGPHPRRQSHPNAHPAAHGTSTAFGHEMTMPSR